MHDQQDRLHTRLVIGLGNPGRQYARTRHNVGFWCVDRLSRQGSITFSRRHRQAVIGEGMIDGIPVALAKPRTFVNNSGQAASFLLARYGASIGDLLVVYDDMALPPGKLRLRPRGGAGGHNGVKSIIETIGAQDFARVRIGIGRPLVDGDEVEYVLGTVPPQERQEIDEAIDRAAQAVVCLLTEGIDVAMDRYN